MNEVKITYLTYDENGRSSFTTNSIVSLSESLRLVALKVINESIGKTDHNWLKQTTIDQPIVFHLEGDGNDVLQDFGIKYGLNMDGSIQFLNDYSPLHHEWTLREIYELRDNNYIHGDKSSILIATPQGLGAVGAEVIHILQIISFIGGVYDGLNVIKRITDYIKIRTFAKKWKSMDLKSLSQIRQFLDQKSVWTTDEIMKRLLVDEKFAINILTKLGYELNGSIWLLAQSKESLLIRSRWLAKEKEIESISREVVIEESQKF